MKDVATIQSLIDERAERRLNKDLADMRSAILGIPVLASTDNGFPEISFKENKTKPYWFFNKNGVGSFWEALFNYWLPIYKTREAEKFMQDIVSLKSDVDDLLSNQPVDY